MFVRYMFFSGVGLSSGMDAPPFPSGDGSDVQLKTAIALSVRVGACGGSNGATKAKG